MSDQSTPGTQAPVKDHGRAGRNLPVAIASGLVLGAAIIVSLVFWKTAFMLIVAGAVVVAIWELHQGLKARGIDIPQEPLMVGGVLMVCLAYFVGTDWLVTATAVTALVTMLWLLRRGVPGYVQNSTASVFTLIYVPFLGSFVALMLGEDQGVVRREGVLGHRRHRPRVVERHRAPQQVPAAQRAPGGHGASCASSAAVTTSGASWCGKCPTPSSTRSR